MRTSEKPFYRVTASRDIPGIPSGSLCYRLRCVWESTDLDAPFIKGFIQAAKADGCKVEVIKVTEEGVLQ